ncbi:MAG: hypothetical protein IJA80_08095 [Clostridia bacterium]|nr:hypothetical protein [Clostridia bacterium]
MTKKESFKLFFSNSWWGIYGWCLFNLIFAITYFITIEYARELDFEFSPSGPDLHECLIPYAIIYIVALVPAFLMGFFWMNKTGNAISDFVSLLPIRFLTVVFSLGMASYHNYHVFVNFSVATLDTMLNYIVFAHRVYRSYDFEPVWYYLTSLIPFVIMFIGFQFGKRRRKNKQEEIKE